MKLYRYSVAGQGRTGCLIGKELFDFNAYKTLCFSEKGYGHAAAERLAEQTIPSDLGDLFAKGSSALVEIRQLSQEVQKLTPQQQQNLRAHAILSDAQKVVYLPPLGANSTIYCVGRNYQDHVAESGMKPPKVPAMFIRTHHSMVGHRQALLKPKASDCFDWEIELAVVIGKECRAVSKKNALSVVAGYTILNDGSVRDYQFAAPMPTAGKNFFRSGSLGPSITTADEISDPHDLRVRTLLNRKVMQDDHTSHMLFNLNAIIAHISEFTPLFPGDIISSGTPSGVGFARTPPKFMFHGDRLRMEIDQLDPLENVVEDEG